jgi:hypothetical protein
MRKLLIITTTLMLAACAPRMEKNVPQAQVDKDVADCNYEVSKASISAATSDYFAGMREGQLFNTCLTRKGYRVAH